MNFKCFQLILVAILLAACDRSKSDLAKIKVANISEVSSTAIFFPGGGGIDFAMFPIADGSGIGVSGRPFKKLYYSFLGRKPEEIEHVIDGLLLKQGYLKKDEALFDGVIKNSLYVKKGVSSVKVQYSERFREGFQRTVGVLFWWYE